MCALSFDSSFTTASSMTSHKSPLRILPLLTRGVVSIACIGAGIGIYAWLYYARAQPSASDPAMTGRLRLQVTTPIEQAVGRHFRAFGQARAVNVADVPARVTATVISVHPNYREGATVAAGDALVSLDSEDFQRQLTMSDEALRGIDARLSMLELDAANAKRTLELVEEDARLAQADFERVKAAAAQDAAIAREVDRARGGAISAERAVTAARAAYNKLPFERTALIAEQARQQAARELARASVERSTIRAPIAGILQLAQLDVGEMAAPGVVVARVVDPTMIEIPILLPALAREFVRVGDSVALRADRAGSEMVEARITRIAPEDDPATRTMTVFAETAGSTALAPGAFVEAEVASAATAARTIVPRRAVNGGRIVTIENGVAHALAVEVEFAISGALAHDLPDTEWLVLKGSIPSATMIVLDGSRRIREGATVEAVKPGAQPATSDAAPASLDASNSTAATSTNSSSTPTPATPLTN